MKIPPNVFVNITKWMAQGPWPDHLQLVLHEHLHAYCDEYDIDGFEELGTKIGQHWLSTVWDITFEDFLSRETEDGNVVDHYLKRRGWNEKVLTKAYLKSIRGSVMSLYEVSDIRPGTSFLARDLILGGEPILVEEKTATKTLAPWDHIAARIVDLRGHNIIAGGVLPFEDNLSAELIEEIQMMADAAEIGVEERFEEDNEPPEDDMVRPMALRDALKLAAPLFTEIWMADTILDENDIILPEISNSDGDALEFVNLHYRLSKGATHLQVSQVLNNADDMGAADEKFWNWVECPPTGSTAKTPRKKGPKVTSLLPDGVTVLGGLELKGRTLEAQTNSADRAERLQARLSDLLGDLVGAPLIERETIEQAFKYHRDNPHEPSEPLNISKEEEAEMIKMFMDQQYKETLDQPVGMLGDKTPRNAVKSKVGKAEVATWIKYLEKQTARQGKNAQTGTYDFTWMWEELGVGHLRK